MQPGNKWILAAFLLSVGMVCGSLRAAGRSDADQFAQKGANLTEQQAKELEQEVAAKPNDLALRTKLLGYYTTAAYDSAPVQAARQELVLWLIENHPDAEISGTWWASLHPLKDGTQYDAAKRQWLRQVDAHPRNVAVLGNAGMALMVEGSDKARELLEQCKSLQPKNAKWAEQLAYWYDAQALNPPAHAPTPSSKQIAALESKAVAELEEAIAMAQDDVHRFYFRTDLLHMALNADQLDKAKKTAEQLLQDCRRYESNWNYGNAIYHAHAAMGQVALRLGDVKEAARQLIEAGKSPGSPELNTVGPDLTLANQLLKKGERKAVVQYLNDISKFWKRQRGEIEQWIKDIEAGETPPLLDMWTPPIYGPYGVGRRGWDEMSCDP